jgi:hypothetical protein
MWLLDMVLNKKLEKPFTKVPPEGSHLDTLNPAEIKAKLSNKARTLMMKSNSVP